MIVARPKYDDETIHLHYWGRVVLEKAKDCHQVKAYDLNEEKCTKKNLGGHIAKLDPRFLIFHTHGDESTIYGNKRNHKEEVLIKVGENDSLLNNRIIYSIACSSSKGLGRKCKPLAFTGYREDFLFYYIPNRLSRPSTDHVARPCLDSTTQIPISIIKGHSVKEAVNKSKMKYIKHIKKQIKSKELEAPYILQSLIDNMSNLELIGDGEVKF